jgi:ubiquinone/menaquinone biosynthesis C-methylase UbiE
MPAHAYSAADVADLYDEYTDLLQEQLGGRAIHLGLGTDEDPDGDPGEAQDQLTLEVARRIGAATGCHVLDIGCGTGQPATLVAATTGASITGITISKSQLAVANERSHNHVQFEEANALALPFPSNHFDAAYMIESFVHMPDQARALAEAARCLRPGGTLVIADVLSPGPIDRPGIEATGLPVHAPPTLTRLEAMLRAANLILVNADDIQDRIEPQIRASLVFLGQDHPEHRARLGQDRYDRYVTMVRAALIAIQDLRYVLVTARKPG